MIEIRQAPQFGDVRLPPYFWDRVQPCPMTGCWLWVGATGGGGYGSINTAGVKGLAHRIGFEVLVGPIYGDQVLDHLCRVRCCVNPEHLEPVSKVENVLRGVGPSAQAARATTCPQGHPYSGANLRIDARGFRRCRTCDAARSKNRNGWATGRSAA